MSAHDHLRQHEKGSKHDHDETVCSPGEKPHHRGKHDQGDAMVTRETAARMVLEIKAANDFSQEYRGLQTRRRARPAVVKKVFRKLDGQNRRKQDKHAGRGPVHYLFPLATEYVENVDKQNDQCRGDVKALRVGGGPEQLPVMAARKAAIQRVKDPRIGLFP